MTATSSAADSAQRLALVERVAKKRRTRQTTRRVRLNANRIGKGDVVDGGPRPYIKPKRPPVLYLSKRYGAGQIIIDTAGRQLFYTLSRGRAYRYPIAVGRDGFRWYGVKRITAKKLWPDWRPPAEMRKRKPELPKLMTGGLWNPLGSKALYLGSSLYRIHGTPNAKSVGTASSSGCFRMYNSHVAHLYRIARVGTRVTVLRRLPARVSRTVRRQLRKSRRRG